MEGYVSTAAAAKIIGCNDSRVRQLLRAKLVKGEKVGRDWLVSEASAREYAGTERKPGPKKKPPAKGQKRNKSSSK